MTEKQPSPGSLHSSHASKTFINELAHSPSSQVPQHPDYDIKESFYHASNFSKPQATSVPFASQQNRISELNQQMQMLRSQNAEQKEMIIRVTSELKQKQKSQDEISEEVTLGKDGFGVGQGSRLSIEVMEELKAENRELKDQLAEKVQELELVRGHLRDSQQRARLCRIGEEQSRRTSQEQELKVSELREEIRTYLSEIQTLEGEVDALRRGQTIRSDAFLTPTSPMRNSRAMSDLDFIDNQRFALKLSEKNREYEQLYMKYQAMESEVSGLEEVNRDLQRERQFLAERLSDLEIHTEGDEVGGELENKLVLMSTELMRLGHLSRTKVQENKDITITLKQSILRREQLEKELIERDKIILNYKEDLRLMGSRIRESPKRESPSQSVRENQQLRVQINEANGTLQRKQEQLRQSLINQAILEEKNSRLISQNEELLAENRRLAQRRDSETMRMNLEAELQFFRDKNNSLKQEITQMNRKMQQQRSEASSVLSQKQDAQRERGELQGQIRQLQGQIRNLQVSNEEVKRQARESRHADEQQMMTQTSMIRQLEEKVRFKEQEATEWMTKSRVEPHKVDQLVREIQRMEGSELSLKAQIKDYEEKIAMLAQENERLTMKVDGLQEKEQGRVMQDREAMERQRRELSRQVQRLNQREIRVKEQNDGLREKLRELQRRENEQEGRQFKERQLRDEIDGLNTQIATNRQEIIRVTQLLETQRSDKSSLVRQNEELSTRVSRLTASQVDHRQELHEAEVRRLREQVGREQEQYRQLEAAAEENQTARDLFSEEIERLNKVLGETIADNMRLKKEVDFIEHKVKVLESSLAQRNELKVSSQSSINQAEYRSKAEGLEEQLRRASSEMESVRRQLATAREAASENEMRARRAEGELGQTRLRVEALQNEVRERMDSSQTREDGLMKIIMEIKMSNESLKVAMGEVKDTYVIKLSDKEAECSRLSGEKKALEMRARELGDRIIAAEKDWSDRIRDLQQKEMTKDEVNSEFERQIIRLNEAVEARIQDNFRLQKQLEVAAHKVQVLETTLSQQNQQAINSQKSVAEAEARSKASHFEELLRMRDLELEQLRSKLSKMRESYSEAEVKARTADHDRSNLQKRVGDLEQQLAERNEATRSSEAAFQNTSVEIKRINEQLQRTITDMEQRYVHRLDGKEQECSNLNAERRALEIRNYELEQNIAKIERQWGGKLQELQKRQLNSEEIYTQLSAQIQRLNSVLELKANDNLRLKKEIEAIEKRAEQKIRTIQSDYSQKSQLMVSSQQSLAQDEFRIKAARYEETINELERQLQGTRKRLMSARESGSEVEGRARAAEMERDHLKKRTQEAETQLRDNIERARLIEDNLRKEITELTLHKERLDRSSAQLEQQSKFKIEEQQLQNNALNSHKKSLQIRIQELEQRLVTEEREWAGKLQEFHSKDIQKDQVYANLSVEIERLRTLLEEKTSENVRVRKEAEQTERRWEEKIRAREVDLTQQNQQMMSSQRSIAENEFRGRVQQYQEKIGTLEGELEGLRKKVGAMRTASTENETKIRRAESDRSFLQGRIRDLEMQLSERTESYRAMEESFRRTVMEVKRTNERLEQSITDIEKHYIQKLEGKEHECIALVAERKTLETRYQEVERKLVVLEQQGSGGSFAAMRESKGMYVIKEASEMDERSRSASGNHLGATGSPAALGVAAAEEWRHKYELLKSAHQKVTGECECYRKKTVEYEFKMKKLKEEFDLINRLIHEYRQENEKLKENNKLLQNQASATQRATSPTHSAYSTSTVRQNSMLVERTAMSPRVGSPINLRP